MGCFWLAVSWCLRLVVAPKRQQAKAVVAKGSWQAAKAIKIYSAMVRNGSGFRDHSEGRSSGGDASVCLRLIWDPSGLVRWSYRRRLGSDPTQGSPRYPPEVR